MGYNNFVNFLSRPPVTIKILFKNIHFDHQSFFSCSKNSTKVGLGNNSENLQKDVVVSKFLCYRVWRPNESNVSETYSGISYLSNDFFEKIYHLNQLYEKFLKKAVNSSVFRLLKFRCQTRWRKNCEFSKLWKISE